MSACTYLEPVAWSPYLHVHLAAAYMVRGTSSKWVTARVLGLGSRITVTFACALVSEIELLLALITLLAAVVGAATRIHTPDKCRQHLTRDSVGLKG